MILLENRHEIWLRELQKARTAPKDFGERLKQARRERKICRAIAEQQQRQCRLKERRGCKTVESHGNAVATPRRRQFLVKISLSFFAAQMANNAGKVFGQQPAATPAASPSTSPSTATGTPSGTAQRSQQDAKGEAYEPNVTEAKAEENLKLMIGILRTEDEADEEIKKIHDKLHTATALQAKRRGLIARGNGFSDEIKNEIIEIVGITDELKTLSQDLCKQLDGLNERIRVARCLLDTMICDLRNIICILRQVNSILCSLPAKIRRAKVRAFIFGFVFGLGLGLGLGALAGGGGGAAVASAPFFELMKQIDLLIGRPFDSFSGGMYRIGYGHQGW